MVRLNRCLSFSHLSFLLLRHLRLRLLLGSGAAGTCRIGGGRALLLRLQAREWALCWQLSGYLGRQPLGFRVGDRQRHRHGGGGGRRGEALPMDRAAPLPK